MASSSAGKKTINLGAEVWERREGYDTLATNLYAALVGFWVTFGIAVAAFGAKLTESMQVSWPLALGCFLSSVVMIFIAVFSDVWFVSAAAYLGLTFLMGALTGPVVALYTTASIFKVMVMTAGTSIGLSVVGAVYPKSLESWGSYLFGALWLLILGGIVRSIFIALGIPDTFQILDYVGAGVFMAYIVYDWNRAMRLPKTADNAVDCAMAIFLDIINLFQYLLKIFGKRK